MNLRIIQIITAAIVFFIQNAVPTIRICVV